MKRKTKVAWAALALLAAVGPEQSFGDSHNRNQMASMEYKQWKFTPDWYYYSWYKEKIDLGLFSITVDVPGLGIHDDGPGGIGGGDGYVDQRWRQMTPLRTTTLTESILQKYNVQDELDYWDEVFKEDVVTLTDSYTNLPVVGAWEVTKTDRNRLKSSITDHIKAIPDGYDKVREQLTAKYDIIMAEVSDIKGSFMSNARKLTLLQNANDRLTGLEQEVKSSVELIRYIESDYFKSVEKKAKIQLII